jgi:hypothetical protein
VKELADDLERCPFCGACVEVCAQSCPACGRELVEEKTAVFRRLRDGGWVTPAAFDVIIHLLESGTEAIDEPGGSTWLRKQVADLTPSDLREYPAWEFAIDEEGEAGQDEETIKPRPDLKLADPPKASSSSAPSSLPRMARTSKASSPRTGSGMLRTRSRRSSRTELTFGFGSGSSRQHGPNWMPATARLRSHPSSSSRCATERWSNTPVPNSKARSTGSCTTNPEAATGSHC